LNFYDYFCSQITTDNEDTIDTLLGNHSSKPRNRNIANVFYKAGFIEAWGRGINKIRHGMEAAKLSTPMFESTMGGVAVTIYRKVHNVGTVNDGVNDGVNDDVKLSVTEYRILNLIVKSPVITYLEIMNHLNLSEATVTRGIRKLRTRLYITRKGSDKTGIWIVTNRGKQEWMAYETK
jgi:ATP-dependent DNA helicase RecG